MLFLSPALKGKENFCKKYLNEESLDLNDQFISMTEVEIDSNLYDTVCPISCVFGIHCQWRRQDLVRGGGP